MDKLCLLLINTMFSIIFSKESIWIFNGNISTNGTYVWSPSLMDDLELTTFEITYKVTFKEDLCHKCLNDTRLCCPHFLVNSWRCYNVYGRKASCEQQLAFFSKPTGFNYYNILLYHHTEYEESGCKLINGDTISCERTISFGRSSPVAVSFTFAACNSTLGIHLSYDVTFRSKPPNCFPNPKLGFCEEYATAGLPGTIGFTTLGDLLRYKALMEFALHSFSSCHQRTYDFICRTALPECDPNTKRLIFPCRQQCEEIIGACKNQFLKAGVKFSCNLYLNTTDEELCFYKPVKCPIPKNPKHGHVKFVSHTWNSTANYSCDNAFFQISGSANHKCSANGTWDNPSPTCSYSNKTIVAVVLPLLLPIFLIVLLVYLVGKRRVHFCPSDEWLAKLKYDAFVAYCNDDEDFVEGKFRKNLEEDGPAFRLCLHGRDFLPGAVIVDTIETSITQSVTCIILVSHSSVHNKWCQFEFKFAHNRIVEEGFPPSSLILVFLDDIPVKELPEGIKAIYYTCNVIKRKKAFFWHLLVKAIKQAKRDMIVPDGLIASGPPNLLPEIAETPV